MLNFNEKDPRSVLSNSGALLRRLRKAYITRLFLRGYVGSQAELSRFLSINKTVIGDICSELRDQNILIESKGEQGPRMRGRPDGRWMRNDDGVCIIGLVLRERQTHLMALSLSARRLADADFCLNDSDVGDALISRLKSEVKKFVNEQGERRIIGVSVISGGRVDSQAQTVNYSLLGLVDYPLAEELEKTLDLPTTIAAIPVARAQGEYWFGLAQGCENYVYLQLLPFLRSCHVRNGEPDLGSEDGGGEIGGMLINRGENVVRFCDWLDVEITGHKVSPHGQTALMPPEALALTGRTKTPEYFRENFSKLVELTAILMVDLKALLDPELLVLGGVPCEFSLEFNARVFARYKELDQTYHRRNLDLKIVDSNSDIDAAALVVIAINRNLSDLKYDRTSDDLD